MIDTHCHMNLLIKGFSQPGFNELLTPIELQQCNDIILDAQQHQVHSIINIGTDVAESLQCLQIAQHFSNCFATVGLHPTSIAENWINELALLTPLLSQAQQKKIVGIGECGIDLYHSRDTLALQEKAFHAQIQLALQHNLALVIHSRNGDAQTYNILQSYRHEPHFKGVMHCFSSDDEYAQRYLEMGLLLGIGGTVTYPKNEVLRSIVATINIDQIILETDAPFLSPQAVRGTKNKPANIALIAQFIAQLRNESLEYVDAKTTETATKLFGLNCF